jgi:hypothetical protein
MYTLAVGPPRPPTGQQNYGPQNVNQHVQPFFQYSQCTGKKKALCVRRMQFFYAALLDICYIQIGINYIGQTGQLRGCINDVTNVVNFLISKSRGSCPGMLSRCVGIRNIRIQERRYRCAHR